MKKLIFIATLSLTLICCNSNKKQDVKNDFSVIDSIQTDKSESIDDNNLIQGDSTNTELNTLPIHGEINRVKLAK